VTGWDQLAEGIFRRRYVSLDLNIGLIVGSAGAVVIDTRASLVQSQELIDHIGELTTTPVTHVVDTHWHWDHTFGNGAFPDAPVWGHHECRRMLAEQGEQRRGRAIAAIPEHRTDIATLEIRLPERVFVERDVIDLGDRVVEMRFLGKGHTEGDIVVTVSGTGGDAGVVFAGDLLEQGAPPMFGDAYPVAWPDTVAAVAALGATTAVPGHGDVMGPSAVATQLEELRSVAALVLRTRAEGADPETVDLRGAPYPEATMRQALSRGMVELRTAPS
jgi:glyoxylase-like metal-dependent hydrolase (beta-lactamase superfamily II)